MEGYKEIEAKEREAEQEETRKRDEKEAEYTDAIKKAQHFVQQFGTWIEPAAEEAQRALDEKKKGDHIFKYILYTWK